MKIAAKSPLIPNRLTGIFGYNLDSELRRGQPAWVALEEICILANHPGIGIACFGAQYILLERLQRLFANGFDGCLLDRIYACNLSVGYREYHGHL